MAERRPSGGERIRGRAEAAREPEEGRSKSQLRARALRLLARREHSRFELERKLQGEAIHAAELRALLDELEQRGWLSEARLAEQRVARAQGRYGSRRVIQDLREKGVAKAVLAEAADQLKQAELASARAVWRKRFGSPPAGLKDKARQARFLAGRGFTAEVIRQVLGSDPEELG